MEAQFLQYKLAKAEAEAKDVEESLAARRTLREIQVEKAKAEAKESLAAERALNKIRVEKAKAEAKVSLAAMRRIRSMQAAKAKADAAAERKIRHNRVVESEARARTATALPPRDTSDGQTRDQDIGPAVMNEMLMQVAAWAGYKDKAS